jgi:hypothetical protein
MSDVEETQLKLPIIERASGFPVYVLLAAICLLGSGVVHGLWTDRWAGTDVVPGEIVLGRVPDKIGAWVGTDLPPLDHPGSISSLHRQYTNELTDRSVNVLLTTGSVQMISDYPITRLFRGHPYRAVSEPSSLSFWCLHEGFKERILHGFFSSDYYEPANLKTQQLIAVWAWTEDGVWESPIKPQDRFDQRGEVYRLYVTQDWDFSAQSRPNDIQNFLTTALPEFSAAIGRLEPPPSTGEAAQ